MSLSDHHTFIETSVRAGRSYNKISEELKEQVGNVKGFSVRSVRRYCKLHNINRKVFESISAAGDMAEVAHAVRICGPMYGRRTLLGFLHSQGSSIGRRKVSRYQKQFAPTAVADRRERAQTSFNPLRYWAHSFGHKIHIDENEKLVEFGVTHVYAVDGYSRMCVAALSSPVKNNVLIYECIFKINRGVG